MKCFASICLFIFMLLRAVAPLGIHASSIRTPPPTVTLHLAYTYDAAGRRTGLTLPDGQSENWSYDCLNNPEVIRQLTTYGRNIAEWGKYTTPTFNRRMVGEARTLRSSKDCS